MKVEAPQEVPFLTIILEVEGEEGGGLGVETLVVVTLAMTGIEKGASIK